MAIDTSTNHVIDFQNTFDDVAQEKQSKMLMTNVVSMETMNGEVKAIDSIGTVEATEIVGRNVAVTFDNIDHLRRQLSTRVYKVTLPVDASSIEDLARDPSGRYAQECNNAFNRRIDQIILRAATADVMTGENMTTTVDFATDGGRTHAGGTLGFTDILTIKQLQSEVATGTDHMEQSLLIITDVEAASLLGETELTSGDFDRLYSRDDNGSLIKVLGMDVIQYASGATTEALLVTAGSRDCLALAGDAIAYGVHQAPTVDIMDMKTQFYRTKAVNIIGRMGAVRREGVRVIRVTTTA